MTKPEPSTHSFIEYLQSLASQDDRGALAALRRGLGQPPGTAAEMYRYVVRFLPQDADRNLEAVHYLVAALFALHPSSTQEGNMGSHLARTLRSQASADALERRFTALLAAHRDDLPGYLRQAVSYLKGKDEPVNWNQLFRDLQNWDHPDRFVQKAWAREFWSRPGAATSESTTS